MEIMKSRRLTVVCMAAIALIGTPRAWQELGNLLEAAQQKAQMKFWSMVMRPAGPAEVELVAEEAVPARHVSPCPEERDRENFELVSYSEPRRARAKPVARRPRTETRSQSLIAHARRKVPADTEIVERAILDGLKDSDFDFSQIAENVPAPQPAPAVKAAPHARPAPADTLSFVQLPTMAPVAATMSDKEVTYHFKLMKKALIDGRLLPRQRSRFPAVKVNTSFPAS